MKITLKGKKGIYLFENEGTNVLRPNGRFSLVYKGKETESGREVIIKKLHPRLQKSETEANRFRNEFTKNPELNFIPTVIDYVEQDGSYYIIREYFSGVDLKYFMTKGAGRNKIKTKEKLGILIQLFEKVKLLHDKGFVHGDIKPSNFIIHQKNDGEYEIKLIDLGLAFRRDGIKSLKRNEKFPLPFSFHYSAPELMLNFPELTGTHTDIFSLGVILYEWLNSALAWENQHPAALTNLQLSQPLPETTKVKGIYPVIEKATAKYNFQQPPNRYETIIQKLYLQEAIDRRYKSLNELISEVEIYRNSLPDKKQWWKFRN